MQFKDLLQQYKERNGVTNDFIAEQVGVNKSTVSRWLKGESKTMKQSVIEKLSYLLNTDVEQILNEDSERYEKPILGKVRAGYNLFAQENFDGYEEVTKSDFYRGDYFLRVIGDSMTGANINDNDLIYVKKCDSVPSGTIAVALIAGEEVTVKRIIYKDNLMILEAANPSVPSRYFTLQETEELPVRIIGKVLYSLSYIN